MRTVADSAEHLGTGAETYHEQGMQGIWVPYRCRLPRSSFIISGYGCRLLRLFLQSSIIDRVRALDRSQYTSLDPKYLSHHS